RRAAAAARSGAAARRGRAPSPAASTAAPPPAARCRRRRTRCARPAAPAACAASRATLRCGARVPPAARLSGRPWLQVRADVDVEGERRTRVVEAARDVHPRRSDWRAPAQADAHAGVPVRRAVEGAAAVHEHRPAPGVVEVVLVLDAGGDHVLRADAEIADARADLAVVVAADAAVAAGVEAQAGR